MSYLPPYAPSQRWCAGPHYMAAIRPQGQSHGRYDPAFPFRECLTLAQEVKEYENAYLTQQISFLETIHEYFTVHNLRHDPEVYHDRMQRYRHGRPVDIKVFDAGELVEYRIAKPDINNKCNCTGSVVE